MDKISIIIPVYNTKEVYLKECVSTILKQDYDEIEIIIIDDGSEKITADLCDKFAEEDKRIVVFHKKNEGVSVARNYGLNRATGDWICFIDSDDWLEENIFQDWLKSKNGKDIIISNMFVDNEKVTNEKTADIVKKVEKKKLINCLLTANSSDYIFLDAVWGKLYRREFLLKYKIVFTKGVPRGEDTLFNLEVFYRANTIGFSKEYTYHYRTNQESVTNQYDDRILEKYDILIEHIRNKLKEFSFEVFEKEYHQFVIRCLTNAFRSYIFNPANNVSEKERRGLILQTIEREPYCNSIKKIQLKNFAFKKKLLVLFIKWKSFALLSCVYNRKK